MNKPRFPVGMEVINVKPIYVYETGSASRVQTMGNKPKLDIGNKSKLDYASIPIGTTFRVKHYRNTGRGYPLEYDLIVTADSLKEKRIYEITLVFENLLAPATDLGVALYGST